MQAGRVIAIIPARAASQRLPHKPLQSIAGVPLICRVEQAVRRSGVFDAVWVACDDTRIVEVVEQGGGQAIIIDRPCTSGTERVAYAARMIATADDFIVNVQGDEPFVTTEALDALVGQLRNGALISTLASSLPLEKRGDPATVKVVCDGQGQALYFSRAAIPGQKHIGLYGFTHAALMQVAHLPRGPLSQAEDLEQLAWMEHGHTLAVASVDPLGPSIDTPDDLKAAERWLVENA